MEREEKTDRRQWIARSVGVLFLLATATYMAGSGLIDTVLQTPDDLLQASARQGQVSAGVLLQFVNAAAVVGIGVLLFPIVKPYSEVAALGYVVTRVLECALLVVSGIGTLALLALSQTVVQAGTVGAAPVQVAGALLMVQRELAYQCAMLTLGVGSLPLCYWLYRARLVPRAFSVLGLLGYVALLVDAALKLSDLDLGLILYLPGGLFELLLPLWLIGRGFDAAALVAGGAAGKASRRENMNLSVV